MIFQVCVCLTLTLNWKHCNKWYFMAAVQEDIVKAMGLTGQLLMGQAVMVKSAEVEYPRKGSHKFGC